MALYAFDGTWNSEKDAGEYDRNTNVVRFKDLYADTKFFYRGVGTKHGFLGKVAGGAFGVGGHERIEDAIVREKAMKAWQRTWKLNLIGQHNPDWEDLFLTLNA